MRTLRWTALAAACTLLALGAQTQTPRTLENYPSPAEGSFSVAGAALPDGRLLLWNGDTLFVQRGLGVDAFDPVAAGYTGDPGFIALAPDGRTALLGAGFSGDLYLVDTADPRDFTPDAIAANAPHYAGVFLTAEFVLIDAGLPDFSGSELTLLRLGGGKEAPRSVVRRSAKQDNVPVANKPPFAYSATLAVDRANGGVYAMDGNSRDLRRFDGNAIITAFFTGIPLDWDADGDPVGEPGRLFGGGVAGIANDGALLVAGSEGFGLPGGIQVVDPDTGAVLDTLDPAGDAGFYTGVYSPPADSVAATSFSGTFQTPLGAPLAPYAHLPAPAPNAFTVVTAPLADGRLLAWNGRDLFEQTGLRLDAFEPIATGYAGDPAFIAVAPDGSRMILGAGLEGSLYAYDSAAPADFSTTARIARIPHYSGVYLDGTVLLLDVPRPDFLGSELVAIDLAARKAAPVPLVALPGKATVIGKPPLASSAALHRDDGLGVVFAMDANTRELRFFRVDALIAAFREFRRLDWTRDGRPVGTPGQYFNGGVAGITPTGYLVVGGGTGLGGPGGVQFVRPTDLAVVETVAVGADGYARAEYNPRTGVVSVREGAATHALDVLQLDLPLLESEGEPEGEGDPEGEGGPEGEGEGEGEGEPEGEGEGGGEPEGEGEPGPAPGGCREPGPRDFAGPITLFVTMMLLLIGLSIGRP